MLIRYPPQGKVNNKRRKKSEKKYACMYLQKPWHYEELQRQITLIALAPSSQFLFIIICLEDTIGMCLQGLMEFHQ